jgi:invasion protein IalB
MRKSKYVIALFTAFICDGIAHAQPISPYDTPAPSLVKTSASGWISKCVSDSRKSPPVCSVEETLVLVNTGQAVASVVVRTQSDDTNKPSLLVEEKSFMMIHVPVGLYLPAGVKFQIDDAEPQPIALQTCDPQGCHAEMEIGSTLLAALKVGKRLSIIWQNSAKNNIVLPLPLNNFAEAFQKIQ